MLPCGTSPLIYRTPKPPRSGCCGCACRCCGGGSDDDGVHQGERRRRASVQQQEPAPDTKRSESLTLCAAVCDGRFWLLGGAKFAGMGCGLMLRECTTTHGLSLSPWVVV